MRLGEGLGMRMRRLWFASRFGIGRRRQISLIFMAQCRDCKESVLPVSIMICRVVLAQNISPVGSSLSKVGQVSPSKFSVPLAFMSLVSLSTMRFSLLMLTLFESSESSRD